jgi:hypothetical protein
LVKVRVKMNWNFDLKNERRGNSFSNLALMSTSCFYYFHQNSGNGTAGFSLCVEIESKNMEIGTILIGRNSVKMQRK